MENSIHKFAAKGFDISTDAYERGRPEYSADAVDCLIHALDLNNKKLVADIGAGTGKLTKLLRKSEANILAIEPVEGMRKKFSSVLPDIEILNGTAEKIPLEDASLDAVVVAQAFHWFKGDEALKEIHRVLKPKGKIGLIWNARDESVDWVSKLTDIIDPHEKGAPRYKSGEWKKSFNTTTLFSPLTYYKFGYVQSGDVQMVVDRIGSISFIASLPNDEKEIVLNKVANLIQTHPLTKNLKAIELPYRTDVFVCEKI